LRGISVYIDDTERCIWKNYDFFFHTLTNVSIYLGEFKTVVIYTYVHIYVYIQTCLLVLGFFSRCATWICRRFETFLLLTSKDWSHSCFRNFIHKFTSHTVKNPPKQTKKKGIFISQRKSKTKTEINVM
jgi:hypothetical protein